MIFVQIPKNESRVYPENILGNRELFIPENIYTLVVIVLTTSLAPKSYYARFQRGSAATEKSAQNYPENLRGARRFSGLVVQTSLRTGLA